MTTDMIPKKLQSVLDAIKEHGPIATCEINVPFGIKALHAKVKDLHNLGEIKEHSKDGRTTLWVATTE